jgi:hypothetical protein
LSANQNALQQMTTKAKERKNLLIGRLIHVLDDEVLTFSPNDRHGYARAYGGCDVAAADCRRIASRVSAEKIRLFGLEQKSVAPISLRRGSKVGVPSRHWD